MNQIYLNLIYYGSKDMGGDILLYGYIPRLPGKIIREFIVRKKIYDKVDFGPGDVLRIEGCFVENMNIRVCKITNLSDVVVPF